MKLRILADDLTGALDSAAAFAGENPVHFDRPGGDEPGVSVVATATRDVPGADLPALLEPARDWLRGANLAFKKIDSLLRGNTFGECAWLARGHTRLVFAPAFPQQRRTTVAGRAWVVPPDGGTPQPIGEVPIADRFAALGIADAWVPDALDDDDLRRIAALSFDDSARGWLWCGSAGLAQALAAVHGLAPMVRPHAPARRPAGVVSASHHPVLRRQWARLLAAATVPCADLSLPANVPAAQAAAHLADGMARLVADDPVPDTIIVIGGDTLRALCRAAGTRSLRASPSPRAGWGRARLVGGRWDGVVCHTRSGAFGDDDDLLGALRTLA